MLSKDKQHSGFSFSHLILSGLSKEAAGRASVQLLVKLLVEQLRYRSDNTHQPGGQ